MSQTVAYTTATIRKGEKRPLHITGYQNVAVNLSGKPNCMLLHFPGDELRLTDGPEHTQSFMLDMTRSVKSIMPVMVGRSISGAFGSATVQVYGDYDVVLAEEAQDILLALEGVSEDRRPDNSPELQELVEWYSENFGGYSFALACFSDLATPTHPIVVEYYPHNDDVLTVPGVDAHDGYLPALGGEQERNFRIAYGVDGVRLDIVPKYADPSVEGAYWAPHSITGFFDNRTDGPNEDYVIALETLQNGFRGTDLVDQLIYEL